MAKAPDPEIAKIVETSSGGAAGIVMLLLGFFAMFISLFDQSAIRLAAYAAVWTGWNVLSGIVYWACQSRTYLVFRNPIADAPTTSPEAYNEEFQGVSIRTAPRWRRSSVDV